MNVEGVMDWDEVQRKSSPGPALGDNLETLSVDELAERIKALENEIARVRRELERKRQVEADAANVFKR